VAQAKVLDKEEVRRVLAVIDAGTNAARNRIAFMLTIEAAMRVGEVAALTLSCVRDEDGKAVDVIELHSTQTKGKRGRRVFVSKVLKRELERYLATCEHITGDKALVRSTKTGKAFSNVTLCTLFTGIYKKAGIRTTSHSGRRTKATRLNEYGVGMRTIQKLMGHRNIATTALYCDVSDDQLTNAVNLV